jgi:hypothetical protein
MRKFIGIAAIIISLTTSKYCFADVFDEMRGGFTDKSDCPILYELGSWEYEVITGGGEYWRRSQNWFGPGSWTTGNGVGLYSDEKNKSYSIIKDPKNPAVLIYIGPWQKVTLTYPTHFWEEKKQIEVEIRMLATQHKNSIRSHFETKDEINAKIPEQKLVLLEPSNELIELCRIRWVSKFGYNAVADYYVNIFRAYLGKSILAGSGKIIDSETGKLIADKDGKLVETKE